MAYYRTPVSSSVISLHWLVYLSVYNILCWFPRDAPIAPTPDAVKQRPIGQTDRASIPIVRRDRRGSTTPTPIARSHIPPDHPPSPSPPSKSHNPTPTT